jgi:glycosyltransferase involved in cell wall biosynthesis
MKKRIGVIVDDITAKAGTERATINLCNGLLKYYPELYEITIISRFSKKGDIPFFDLNTKIEIEHLETINNFRFWNKFFLYRILLKLVKAINRKHNFDLLLGTTYVHNNLLPLIVKNTETKTMGCEHVVYNYPPKFIQILRKKMYPKLNSVIVLNETEYTNFSFLNNISVIPNCLPFETDQMATLKEKRIISVGRLTHEKGFDILIDIFENVFKEKPDWELMIYGEGEEYNSLELKIKKNKLEKNIQLCGTKKNISKHYLESSIFVLSSRSESFGIVLIEAMNHGLPVISFDCDGPKNLISNDENGFLIPQFNIKEFSEKLLFLIDNEEKRQKMGEIAKQTSLKYKENKIIPLWNIQIQSLLMEEKQN